MMSTYIQRKKDEEGFTLIELLVVVIIIGILAAIAIPVFLNQRENAWRAAVESDLRNLAVGLESHFSREGSYPSNGTINTDGGLNSTVFGDDGAFTLPNSGVVLTRTDGVRGVYTLADNTTYAIVGTHENLDESITYDSATGGLGEWDDD